MSKSIFVTRHLGEDDPWRKALTKEGFGDVKGWSMLAFEAVAAPTPPPCEWVFAYSRNAVRFGNNVLEHMPKDVKVAAMGAGTAAAWGQASKKEPEFIGEGTPDEVAAAFGEHVDAGAKVLFLQAKESMRSVEKVIGKRVKAVSHVVYRSVRDGSRTAPESDVYLLTSPKNAEAALGVERPQTVPELWVLGPTTEAWCREYGYEAKRWTPPA